VILSTPTLPASTTIELAAAKRRLLAGALHFDELARPSSPEFNRPRRPILDRTPDRAIHVVEQTDADGGDAVAHNLVDRRQLILSE